MTYDIAWPLHFPSLLFFSMLNYLPIYIKLDYDKHYPYYLRTIVNGLRVV